MTSTRNSTFDPVNAVTRHRLLVGVVAVMSALAAHAAGPQTMKLSMQPKKGHFAERCFMLESGQHLAYQFSTRHPVDFNLHHHPDKGATVFPDRLLVKSEHSKQFVAESAGEYCFMTKNPTDQPGAFDVVINYEITAQ